MNLDMLKSTTITATTGVTLGENAANKTRLHKIVLRKNGTAVTAGIAGFGNEDASPAAKTRTYTGSTTAAPWVSTSRSSASTKWPAIWP